MKRSIHRICILLLAAVAVLSGLTLPSSAEPAAQTLPYNEILRLTVTDELETIHLQFTAPTTDNYTLQASLRIDLDVYDENNNDCGEGDNGNPYRPYNYCYGGLRNLCLRSGTVYDLRIRPYDAGELAVRIVSFADQLSAARASGAPVLREGEKVRVTYDGTMVDGYALFTPAATGLYEISSNPDVCMCLCGADGSYGSIMADYRIRDAALIGGETYLLHFYDPAEADISVKRVDKGKYEPVPFVAEDLAAGPLRYTVLIVDDTSLADGVAASERAAALRLCQALSEAPGKSYIAIVSMGMYMAGTKNTTFFVTSRYDRENPRVSDIFSSDQADYEAWIDYISGQTSKGCDINTALGYADDLLRAVTDTYGGAVETNIVLCTDGDNKDANGMYYGPYTTDSRVLSEWADASCCNLSYRTARFVSSKYPLYVLGINVGRYHYYYGEHPISEEATAVCERFIADLASAPAYAYSFERDGDMAVEMGRIADAILRSGAIALTSAETDVRALDLPSGAFSVKVPLKDLTDAQAENAQVWIAGYGAGGRFLSISDAVLSKAGSGYIARASLPGSSALKTLRVFVVERGTWAPYDAAGLIG